MQKLIVIYSIVIISIIISTLNIQSSGMINAETTTLKNATNITAIKKNSISGIEIETSATNLRNNSDIKNSFSEIAENAKPMMDLRLGGKLVCTFGAFFDNWSCKIRSGPD